MKPETYPQLLLSGADVANTLTRFSGNEALYVSCLRAFLSDPTLAQLDNAIALGSWDEAFTAAHALKGLTGNMGFVPLYHATSEIVVLLRAGKLAEIPAARERLAVRYKETVDAIEADVGYPATT